MQVRDRATLYLEQLDGEAGGPGAITANWTLSAKNLEAALQTYLEGPAEAPFDLVCKTCFLRPGPLVCLGMGGCCVVCARARIC